MSITKNPTQLIASTQVSEILSFLPSVRVGVVGDFALDVYWEVDSTVKEQSLETGHITRSVFSQRTLLGGAGNVAANLRALGCGTVRAFGVVGPDLWGDAMRQILAETGADSGNLLRQPEGWATQVFLKPHEEGAESNRYDFGNFNVLDDAVADALLERLEADLGKLDAVVVNQQAMRSIHSQRLQEGLRAVMARHQETPFLVDSRDYPEVYPNAIWKINDREAMRLTGVQGDLFDSPPYSEVERAMKTIQASRPRPLFVTRGERGCLACDGVSVFDVPGVQIMGTVDIVGAGDSMLAGIAAAMTAGASVPEAAAFGNLVAALSVQQIGRCGVVEGNSVLEFSKDVDYVYNPELAEDARQARMIPDTDFEIADRERPPAPPRFAIFDHDGTISVLREGWEAVMGPVMMRAVLGPQYETASENLFHRVQQHVEEFIEKTTGIQTIVQMRGLVEMVQEFGCVPEEEILDAAGYKAIYNDALMEMVNARMQKLERGELGVEDFTLKNAVTLLERLRTAGVRLYLASGTDEKDVVAEARALGYADWFDGGIRGSVGNMAHDAKKLVLDSILDEIGRDGMSELVTFGDGPVELRETRKRGGYAIGLASDEVRRFGWNASKRARVVRAGADLIVPDYSKIDKLLAQLRFE